MDATKQYTKRTTTQIVLDVAGVTPKSAVRSHGKTTPIHTRKNRSGTNTKLAAKTFHLNLYTQTPKSAASKMPRSDDVATSGLETNASATWPVKTAITTLSDRVIGQDEAIAAVSNAIRRNKTGIGDEHRPLGSFLFAGPTGVGKTELAKVLASMLFDDEKALTRIDMSEYMEKFSVSRLIGAPPGYVGYDEGGQLTEVVRRRPYSVVLFDEIEKAHPDVFNVLLQILDDGRLTDGQGRLVDFTNTIIIMTSNLGSRQLMEAPDLKSGREAVMEVIRASFKPEFINRIDEIIIFNQLGKEQISGIVELQLKRLADRLMNRNLKLSWDRSVVDMISEAGFDPDYGARPIKRAIQTMVENPLAVDMLHGRFSDGDSISLSAPHGQLEIERVS